MIRKVFDCMSRVYTLDSLKNQNGSICRTKLFTVNNKITIFTSYHVNLLVLGPLGRVELH